jgi:hypothetical protein
MVLVAAVGAILVAVAMSAPAAADPLDDPCSQTDAYLCRLLPVSPGLVGNVDLTGKLPPVTQDESLPPVDMCAKGCI